MNDEFIRMAILENIMEAQIMDKILDDENIPHEIRSYRDTAYDGLFQTQKGWGEVRAPISFKDDIRDIINDMRNMQKR